MKFSITIPSYKKRYLSEAIESVLAQTYTNYELIIVDDCSPEDLKSVIDKYDDARIHYYRNSQNCGAFDVVDNWNICLGYCTGDYVICMGDDDRLLPCCLEEYVKLIEKYPKLGVYHAWTEVIDEKSNHLNITAPRPEYETCMSLIWNRWHGYTKQFIGDFCFDVNLLKADGGFFKLPMAWASDDISAVRAARVGGIANTQILCFQYRQNRYTISSTGSSYVKADAIVSEKKWYKEFLRNYKVKENSIDALFYISVMTEIEQHFREKFKGFLSRDMKASPLHVFHWIKYRKKYNLSIIRVLYSFKMGFESRFHGM